MNDFPCIGHLDGLVTGDKIKVIFNEFRDEKLVFRLSLNDIYKKHEPPKDIRNNN